MVLLMLLADVKYRETSLLVPCGDDPLRVTRNEDAHMIRNRDRIDELAFEELRLTRDEVFQLPFSLVVAGPKRFLGLKQEALREMRVEVARDVARTAGRDMMRAEQPAHRRADNALPDTLRTAQNDRRPDLLPWFLKELREPAEQPLVT